MSHNSKRAFGKSDKLSVDAVCKNKKIAELFLKQININQQKRKLTV